MPDQQERVLLVAGNDDYHVIQQLLKQHDISVPDDVCIIAAGNDDKVLDELRVRLKGSLTRRLGVVVDADDNPDGRWQALRGRLVREGVAGIPAIPEREGTILNPKGMPRLGLWLMPDNTEPGMLEDFIRLLVPPDDRLIGHAITVVSEIPIGLRRFRECHTPKAIIHTWLAWQEDPGTRMGLAIKKRYFDAHAEKAKHLVELVRRLFLI